LNSNFLIDNWQQFWDNHQARARKQANAMPPQYMDAQRVMRSSGGVMAGGGPIQGGVLPPGSQYGANMNYGMHGPMTPGAGQMGYPGQGQPTLPMRQTSAGMQGMPHPQVYPLGGVGQFQVPESKAFYGSLPKVAASSPYALLPQSPGSMYAQQNPNMRGYPNMPSPGGQMYPMSLVPGGPMAGGFPQTPQTPSSAPQTPVEPPSPGGASGAASGAGAAAAAGSAAPTERTAKRAGKASEKAKATGKRTSAKAKETAAAAAAAAAAATATPNPSNAPAVAPAANNATNPSMIPNPAMGQPPLSLPLMPNGAMGMRSMTPPPHGMGDGSQMWHMQSGPYGAGAMSNAPGGMVAQQPRWLTPGGASGAPSGANLPTPLHASGGQPSGVSQPPGHAISNPGAPLPLSASQPSHPPHPGNVNPLNAQTSQSGQKLNASAPNLGHPAHLAQSMGLTPQQQHQLQQQQMAHRAATGSLPGSNNPNFTPVHPNQLQYPLMGNMGAPNMSQMHLQQQAQHAGVQNSMQGPHNNHPGMGAGLPPGAAHNPNAMMHGHPMNMQPMSPHMGPGQGAPQNMNQMAAGPGGANVRPNNAPSPMSMHPQTRAMSSTPPGVQNNEYGSLGARSDSGAGMNISDTHDIFSDSLDGLQSHASVSGGAFADGDSNFGGFNSGDNSNGYYGGGSGVTSCSHQDAKSLNPAQLNGTGAASGLDSSLEADYDNLLTSSNRKRKHPGYDANGEFGDLNSPRTAHMPYNHVGVPNPPAAAASSNMVSSSIMGLHSQYGMNGLNSAAHGMMGPDGRPMGPLEGLKSENGSHPTQMSMSMSSANAAMFYRDNMNTGGMGAVGTLPPGHGGNGALSSVGGGAPGYIQNMMDVSGSFGPQNGDMNEMEGVVSATAGDDGKVTDLMGEAEEDVEEQPLTPAYQLEEYRRLADHASKVLVCAFDSTGKWLATGGGGTDAPIRVWDVERGVVHVILKGHTHNVTGLKWSANPATPNLLLSCSLDCTIRLWDISNTESPEVHSLKHTQPLNALDWHPTCFDRFICTDHMEQLVFWFMKDATRIEDLPSQQLEGIANKQVRYSPNGRFIAAGLLSSSFSSLKILDGETHQVLHELAGHERQIIGLHWIDDSLVVSTSEDAVKVWKIAASSAECIQQFSAPGDKTYYAIPHPKCTTRILIGAYQKVYDWDYYSTKSRGSQCHDGIISCLSFSKSSDMLSTASHDKLVKLWKLNST
jgi:WD40 repeat protein